ncbi:hypothetical protein V2J09_012042 [Rumex salicifolius]
MTWIKSLSRIGQVVVGSAKLLRIGSRNERSFQRKIQKLEELSVTCRGKERTSVLRKWLAKLKEGETIDCDPADDFETILDDTDDSSQTNLDLYLDLDNRLEPYTFRDVFLHSEALEGITLSLIREAPSDEDVSLIKEIFGYCLIGGIQVHNAIVSSIEDLAKVFSCYQDEVLMKREDLLEFAQTSISGLKINAQQARIDVEVVHLKTELSEKEIKIPSVEDHNNPFEQHGDSQSQVLKEAVAQVRIYSKLQELLAQNKTLKSGVSQEAHSQKVDKLKILLESLANSTSKAQLRIQDHRYRTEEALSFRMAKVSEVSQVEKDLEADLEAFQRRKEELEAELKRVNSAIVTVSSRLRLAREERQQFDETSTDILQHLQYKEEEILRSIASCKVEAAVASAWISFVESTWRLQCIFSKQKEEHINTELTKYAECFVNLLSHILSAYENELSVSINLFRDYVQKLKDGSDDIPPSFGDEALKSAKDWKMLEEEYHEMEAKLVPTFKVVENIRQLRARAEEFCRKDDRNVERLLDELQKMKDEFDSIERPNLQSETPNSARWRSIMKFGFKETPTKLEPIQEEPDLSRLNDGNNKLGTFFSPEEEELAKLEAEYVKIIKDNTIREQQEQQL